ncbi:MAG TPA: M28 family peptidase, partial [Vicinamibacterales bacterium]|nr:M28 family peptidase [Vicinamibacterales bacterium]
GYGLDVDARRDYARLNVKDRIVLAFEGAPTGLDLQPAERSTFTKARTARERGARGLLLVQAALEAPLPRDRIWVLRPENLLEGFMLGRVSSGVAGELAGMDPAALRRRADDPGAAGAMRAAEIAWRVSVVFDPARAGANVLGRLIGRDAALRDQVVIVGAHYDGGGVDPDGTVYPGAEDNASGISIVLALARTLAAAPRSARTIVLAGWGAEEQGAWGSRHYVDSHPQLGRIAATFTLDNAGMGDGGFRLYGATNFPEEWAVIRPTIPPALRASFDPRGAGGSDGWTFQIRGIPSFFAHAAAPQPYVHTPGDTPSTLTRISLDHAGGFMAAAVLAAANAPASFVDSRRLDRYLARHGFIVGYTRAARPDWAALRRRGFDLVIWERPTADAAAPPEASNGIVMVKGRDDLADTEEGRPLRVLTARSDGATLAFRESGVSWRRTHDGWQAGALTVQLVSAPASATASLAAGVAFILDADAQLRVDEITGALIGVGQTVDEIEALVGGRARDALQRAMPPLR